MTVRTIVTIGGGKMEKGEARPIDKEIVRLSGKKHPRLLFIPTASSDAEGYWKMVQKNFRTLGCTTDVLFLLRENPTKKEIEKKIYSADIIYVGGGNTLKMMRLWRRLGVDQMLRKALQKGTVLCGLSAGSICWYESGHSDSMSFYNPKKWKYIAVKGLGFIKGIHCPHYDSATLGVMRKEKFHQMLQKYGGRGIAIDNNCAIVYVGETYRVIASKKSGNAYKVYTIKGRAVSERIEKSSNFHPIAELYR